MSSITDVNSNTIHVGANQNQAESKQPEVDPRAILAALEILKNAQAQPSNESSVQELTLALGKYRGKVKNGVPNGQGTLNYPSSHSNYLKYEGDFEDGLPHGQGVLSYSAGGGTFRGHFVKGDPFKGVATTATNSTFTGTFKVNKTGGLDIVDGTSQWLTTSGWRSATYKNGKDTRNCCERLCTIS